MSVAPGFLLVDKDSGWTSHDVVAKVRSLLKIKKVGHAGTLDPMATGLVVLGLGRATRLLRYVQAAPKEYVARAVFGVATDSLDADGSILERCELPVSQDEVIGAMGRFVGKTLQVPPMVSARKVDGRRLYDLARQGVEIEREAREIDIYQLELIDFAPSDYPEVTFRVVCSTGTYVRVLADDIARALGGRAHLSALRRVRNGSLHVADSIPVHDLESAAAAGSLANRVLAPPDGLPDLAQVEIGEELVTGVRNGLAFPLGAMRDRFPASGPVALIDRNKALVAVYRVESGRAAPEVVIS
jgi:tRNA pseudouridine55 synthase